MTVKELIERLQALDPNFEVYITNVEETQLSQIDVVIPCEDFGENDREEFVAIFPKDNPQPQFTLTPEDVKELQDPIQYFANELKSGWLKQGAISYLPSYSWDKAINNLLTRIKQWQNEKRN